MSKIYEKRFSLSRKLDREIWRCPRHTLEPRPGKKEDTDNHPSNHASLVKRNPRDS